MPPPNAKLGQLRDEIAEYTQLPRDSFKLIHAGAVMKDDNALGTCVCTQTPRITASPGVHPLVRVAPSQTKYADRCTSTVLPSVSFHLRARCL